MSAIIKIKQIARRSDEESDIKITPQPIFTMEFIP
jgi:hypothetical protein